MVTLGVAWHGPVGFHFQCVIIVQPCCAYVILGECNKLRMNDEHGCVTVHSTPVLCLYAYVTRDPIIMFYAGIWFSHDHTVIAFIGLNMV